MAKRKTTTAVPHQARRERSTSRIITPIAAAAPTRGTKVAGP